MQQYQGHRLRKEKLRKKMRSAWMQKASANLSNAAEAADMPLRRSTDDDADRATTTLTKEDESDE